jgi:hypothetical protein
MLTYRCPVTRHDVVTAIETSEDKLRQVSRLLLSLWCPHCKESHQIPGKDASLISPSMARSLQEIGHS